MSTPQTEALSALKAATLGGPLVEGMKPLVERDVAERIVRDALDAARTESEPEALLAALPEDVATDLMEILRTLVAYRKAAHAALSSSTGEPDGERDALRTTISAAIANIAHGRTGAAVAGLRAAREQYGFWKPGDTR